MAFDDSCLNLLFLNSKEAPQRRSKSFPLSFKKKKKVRKRKFFYKVNVRKTMLKLPESTINTLSETDLKLNRINLELFKGTLEKLNLFGQTFFNLLHFLFKWFFYLFLPVSSGSFFTFLLSFFLVKTFCRTFFIF